VRPAEQRAAQLGARPDRAAERAARRARGWPAARERPAAQRQAARQPEEVRPEPAQPAARPQAERCAGQGLERREPGQQKAARLRAGLPEALARCAEREPQAVRPGPALRRALLSQREPRPERQADGARTGGPGHPGWWPPAARDAESPDRGAARVRPEPEQARAARRRERAADQDAGRPAAGREPASDALRARLLRAARGAPRRAHAAGQADGGAAGAHHPRPGREPVRSGRRRERRSRPARASAPGEPCQAAARSLPEQESSRGSVCRFSR